MLVNQMDDVVEQVLQTNRYDPHLSNDNRYRELAEYCA